jgi:hypothetical protein
MAPHKTFPADGQPNPAGLPPSRPHAACGCAHGVVLPLPDSACRFLPRNQRLLRPDAQARKVYFFEKVPLRNPAGRFTASGKPFAQLVSVGTNQKILPQAGTAE